MHVCVCFFPSVFPLRYLIQALVTLIPEYAENLKQIKVKALFTECKEWLLEFSSKK